MFESLFDTILCLAIILNDEDEQDEEEDKEENDKRKNNKKS